MPGRRSHRHRIVAVALAVAASATVLAAPSPAVAAGPQIGSPAAILVEPATGDIVYSRRANQERAIASTTKMMTALVTLEHADLGDTFVTVPYHGLAVESTAGFNGGERVRVRDLLRALLVASANDAAETLAVRVGGSRERFVEMMNARARKIGLTHTHFANPIGLDAPGNYSSATDLVKMALLLRTNPFVRETVDKPKVTLQSGARKRTLKNRNTLIGKVAYVNGVKTGHTQTAGYVLVSSASRNGVTFVSAVLGASSEGARNSDTLALLRYGLRRYHVVTAVTAGKVYARAKLRGRDEQVDLVAGESLKRTVRNGQTVTVKPVVPAEIDGPAALGAQAGTLNVLYRGKVVATVPLRLTKPVAAAPAGGSGGTIVALAGLALVGLAAGTISFVLLRRRAVRRQRRAGAADSNAGIA